MKGDPQVHDSRAGFTLIEVLAAMIILAIGLLGLESMGIYAARSVILAQKQSEYALTASRHLEAAVDSIDRLGAAVPCGTVMWSTEPANDGSLLSLLSLSEADSDVIRRTITGEIGQRGIKLEVIPDPDTHAVRPATLEIQTHVFVANAPSC